VNYATMNDVSEKFKCFVIYLHQNCINKYNTINILRKIYDKNSYIECGLIVYAVDNIVYL